MKAKNIAVLVTALDFYAQVETLKGIEEYGKKHGFNIAVFLWFAGALERDKQNIGELNIIYLPDFNLFDGVIVFANTLHLEANRQRIEEVLEDISCPVVTIGCKIKDYTSVYTDGYAAMREIVEYFVNEKQMTNIHFVKGIEGNMDAESRYQAYVDVLTEHDIPVLEERVTQGDFYVTGGARAVKEIMESKLSFPEAIVCANDVMAITVCDLLMAKGYNVPEDVMISGYDCSLEGQQHSPKMTTVRIRFHQLGETACKMLIDEIEGEEIHKDLFLPDEIILNESCGHHEQYTIVKQQSEFMAETEAIQRRMIYQTIFLEKNIMEGEGFDDWKESVQAFVEQMEITEFYCCVNEDFVENVFELDVMDQEDMSIKERLAYTQDVDVILAYKNGVFKQKASFASRYAFDEMFHDSDIPRTYIFSPFHYLDRTFGYFVFVDSLFPKGNSLYISWLIKMGHFIETIRKQSLLQNAMARLDDMYIRDSLTGAYNRFGLERFYAEIKKKCLMSRLCMQLSFIDLDGLKGINDAYGHEEGDRIITAAANILKKRAGKFKVIRYGGDEFVVMGTVKNEKEIEAYWKIVEEDIRIYNETIMNKAELSLSYGYDVFRVGAETHLEDCLRITDHKMYENKKRKKGIE
ncbi:MAG: GGDEF domain-containing protein [Lachnospiraceae bacterium]|nr:GGDEF domain-containing protein [Lachnospiraceae bacterium]